MKMGVTAEGVETEEQAELVRALPGATRFRAGCTTAPCPPPKSTG
jgi:hypothetical protein